MRHFFVGVSIASLSFDQIETRRAIICKETVTVDKDPKTSVHA